MSPTCFQSGFLNTNNRGSSMKKRENGLPPIQESVVVQEGFVVVQEGYVVVQEGLLSTTVECEGGYCPQKRKANHARTHYSNKCHYLRSGVWKTSCVFVESESSCRCARCGLGENSRVVCMFLAPCAGRQRSPCVLSDAIAQPPTLSTSLHWRQWPRKSRRTTSDRATVPQATELSE